ncbi:MAG TPA: hypothetical protein VD905_09620, partial [Flavobacteriales bacterium]|nr:hypothetical protein [Flavobacteriales bacterium]
MKKQLIRIAFAALCFAACGGKDKEDASTGDTTEAAVDETAPEPKEAIVEEAQEPEPEPAAPIDQR